MSGTPKAFVNSSPGFLPWVHIWNYRIVTPEALANTFGNDRTSALRGLSKSGAQAQKKGYGSAAGCEATAAKPGSRGFKINARGGSMLGDENLVHQH